MDNEILKVVKEVGSIKTVKELDEYVSSLPTLLQENRQLKRLFDKLRLQLS